MERFTRLASRTVVLAADDVDTDQIVPARFLKGTGRAGLGSALFADWRHGPDGRPRHEFALDRPEAAGAEVLVAGSNFGCGSSREHAVWALQEHGFRAVVAASFADIFRRNALKNGLLPVALEGPVHRRLWAEPGLEVVIDLASQTLTLPDGTGAAFAVHPFARRCLLSGLDELSFLLSQERAVAAFEARRPRWNVVVV